MFAVLSFARRLAGLIATLFALLWLAACQPVVTGGGGPRINASAPVPVALLVPRGSQSPGDAILARHLENAARLAIADLDGVRIDLRVYDTAGQPAQSAQAAKQAVNDGARIILGPVFAANANAAGLAALNRNVNVLSFSSTPAIAGGNVFILGNTYDNTANRLVGFARNQGKGRIMIVHPDAPNGIDARNAIERAISRHGAQLAAAASYELSQQGVINAVPEIARKARSSGAQSLFFTADTAGALPFLAQLLPENGVSSATTQFVGMTRWDIPRSTLSMPGLQGGWFALPDPARAALFAQRYSAAYGEPPHPIAGLAYDGIAAIGALVKSRGPDALTRQALTQPAGFIGVNGIFRLLPDGTNERALAVAEVRDGDMVIISPAPRSFGGAGF